MLPTLKADAEGTARLDVVLAERSTLHIQLLQ